MVIDRDDASIVDLVLAGRLIQQFVAGQEFADFTADAKTQSAVVMQILILGEAAKRLSTQFREAHPEIAWSAHDAHARQVDPSLRELGSW